MVNLINLFSEVIQEISINFEFKFKIYIYPSMGANTVSVYALV